MYEIRYVNKRIRRIAAAIVGGVSATVVSVFSIVAFLGRFVGTFTVSLDNANVALTLSEQSSFARRETFLHVDTLPVFGETTYFDLDDDEVIDNEETPYLYGGEVDPDTGEVTRLNYFKYTFFVKNVGNVSARYQLRINIIDNQLSEGGDDISDTMRVMLYSNLGNGSAHNKTVYAKRAERNRQNPNRSNSIEDPDYEIERREPISITEDEAKAIGVPFPGYAEMFVSDTVIAMTSVDNFVVNEVMRYTLVMWLEGYDGNSIGHAPESAKIKIGVEINAYEN